MTALTDFLLANPVDTLTEEVVVSKRIKDEEGNLLKFKVKPMLNEEYLEYQNQCTVPKKGGKIDFNAKKFNQLVILNHTVEPNFRDAELIQKAGVRTPEQLLNKMLLAGEIQVLSEQIRVISGFEDSLDELVDEVKN
jgi:hypothetical protein